MRTKEVEVNKFIDSAVPSNKKGRLVDEGSSSLMSTPQPLNNFPEKQIEPEKQTGFSFKQQ
jgi:ABC-type arginine transport system ATPase subunit